MKRRDERKRDETRQEEMRHDEKSGGLQFAPVLKCVHLRQQLWVRAIRLSL